MRPQARVVEANPAPRAIPDVPVVYAVSHLPNLDFLDILRGDPELPSKLSDGVSFPEQEPDSAVVHL